MGTLHWNPLSRLIKKSQASRFFFIGLLCLSLLNLSANPYRRVSSNSQDIYTDSLAPGWNDWSWATVDLQATAPVHAGTYSISVIAGAWEGVQLHYPGLSTNGFTHLRFFIHGGSAGGQLLNVYATYTVDGSDQQGTSIALSPLSANTWNEVDLSLADLGIESVYVTNLVWQNATGNALPIYYLDDIAFYSDEDPDGPALSAAYLLPRAVPADGNTQVVVRLQVSDPQGQADCCTEK